jgi:peptidyl-prolyl cis-trans isomerase D
VALALLAASGCDRPGGSAPVAATAAGEDLTVDDVVALLVGESYPNEVQVPYTLAELWVDYILLGRAFAEDSTLSQIDVTQIVEQQAEQDMILGLREDMVKPDTVVTDAQIAQHFSQTAPGARVHARHIFLATPETATPVQRDSVRALAASLRDRVVRGESFEQLARQYSNDPGTAADGGDLGWLDRNELFAPLDSTVFALAPGEVSDVVQSMYGLHVVRVEEKETPSLDQMRPQVQAEIQAQRVAAAESTLIASVEEGADLQVQPGAVELARRAAETPGMQLSRRASERALVSYRGGKLTMGDVVTFMQSRTSQFRIDLFNATDQAVEQNLLLALAQRKLLAAEARERGFTVQQSRLDSLTQELRARLVQAARELSLDTLPAGNGEAARTARKAHADGLLKEMLRGRRNVTPLGSFSFILRDEYGGQVNLPAIQLVVQRIQQARGPAPAAPADSTGAPGPLAPPPAGSPLPGAPPGAPAPGAPPGGRE